MSCVGLVQASEGQNEETASFTNICHSLDYFKIFIPKVQGYEHRACVSTAHWYPCSTSLGVSKFTQICSSSLEQAELKLLFLWSTAPKPVLHINSNLHIVTTLVKLAHVNYLYKNQYVH